MESITSCLMLAANLETPVSLKVIFDEIDLKDTGIEFDSHITVLYAADKFLEKGDILDTIDKCWWKSSPPVKESIFDYLERQKSFEENAVPVLDLFELGNFENDSGYVVLKLKHDNFWYTSMSKLNKSLSEYYKIKSKFPTYTPHLTLAEVEPGTSSKYVENETLKKVLRDSYVHFEDFIISYDRDNSKEYDVHDITHNHSVDRYFRLRDLRNEE